jgi:ATP/maltotriose-dependent transcriptional regulator MalT
MRRLPIDDTRAAYRGVHDDIDVPERRCRLREQTLDVEFVGDVGANGDRCAARGQDLRREGRRVDAREQLRTAHEMLAAIGMKAFAERARRELVATGEKVRKRSVDTRDELTGQERQIAGLARDGLSNPEIGARLFLSSRTVEWHLGKVFTKLSITSRMGLRDALPSPGQEATPA